MNISELASRLKKARKERGVNQQSVAESIGLPRTAITQIEAGNRSVSTLELTKFAKLYRYPISYFLDEVITDNEDINVMLYRAAPELNPTAKEQVFHCIDLCKEGLALEKILDFGTRLNLPQYNLPFPKNKSEAAKQGSYIAAQERQRLSIGFGAIADITHLIAQQGIWVCAASLPEDVSGLFMNSIKTGLIILVNATHVNSRKRFSYAHEYAHALFDRNDSIRVSSTKNNSEFIEVRANAFAASFLMPEDGINEVLRSLNKGKPSRQEQPIFDVSTDDKIHVENRTIPYSQDITFQDISIISHHFGVSYHAAVYRLRSINIITQNECDLLVSKYPEGKRYLSFLKIYSDLESKDDKELWDREIRNEIVYLAIEAFRREEISRGRIIELGNFIGLGGKELFELAQATVENGSPKKSDKNTKLKVKKDA